MSHAPCFEFLGGVPELIIPDNLKIVVTKPCRYEPDLNPTYQQHNDLLELIDARYDTKSTLISSQLPIENYYNTNTNKYVIILNGLNIPITSLL